MAKPLPRRFPLRPVWPRRNARLPNASASENWASNFWRSTSGSVNCVPWRNSSHPPRKKNGRSYPKGDRARSRPTLARRLQRPKQNRVGGSGGYRDGCALGHAPRWSDRSDPIAAISDAASRPRHLPCPCGHDASCRGLRCKPILTAVGQVIVSRPYYLCSHCHTGQFPADVEMDIANKEVSPGVRRMQAVVGQEVPFDHGRRQLKLLADLEITTKAVERTAEAIGG